MRLHAVSFETNLSPFCLRAAAWLAAPGGPCLGMDPDVTLTGAPTPCACGCRLDVLPEDAPVRDLSEVREQPSVVA